METWKSDAACINPGKRKGYTVCTIVRRQFQCYCALPHHSGRNSVSTEVGVGEPVVGGAAAVGDQNS